MTIITVSGRNKESADATLTYHNTSFLPRDAL